MSIKIVKDGKIKDYNSDFYQNYINAERRTRESDEWKHLGAGARFREDDYGYEPENTDEFSYFNSLEFIDDDEILYSVTINSLSGIMRKNLSADKDSEGHIIHSRDVVFEGAIPNRDRTKFLTCVKDNFVNAHLSEYDLKTDDYVTLTDGDCYDSNPYYSQVNEDKILFSSKGAGRDSNGNFVRYSNAKICTYDRFSGDIDEIAADDAYSFVKPKDDKNGNLYFIRRLNEKPKKNFFKILLDIVLIPWRILQAIYYFLETFTLMFTGRKFIKDGSNPAKTRDKSKQQTFIEGNLINAENEYKNNMRHKDANAGYAPWSWELIKRSPNGADTVIRHGVIDYYLSENGEIVVTNGKHVLLIDENGKEHKIADASLCTKVSAI